MCTGPCAACAGYDYGCIGTDATGKVKDVHLLEPATAPDPVGHGVEDEDLPHHGEEEGRLPLDTLSIRAVHTITE
jgi:hypothetical protein